MRSPTGVLLLDKPPGPTSHDLVARARKATGLRRVGHAGTLDPFASGLLLILLGPATRLFEYFLGLDKEYVATAHLGIRTVTDDPEGDVLEEREGAHELSLPEVEEAMAAFQGAIRQIPPVYSAKKIRGRPAHRRARKGEEVRLEPVRVTVHALEVLELAPPYLRFRTRCSSGTYLRALARDLGERLGTGAHLTALRRTAIGALTVEDAHSPTALDASGNPEDLLLSPARALSHLPFLELEPEAVEWVRQGRYLPAPGTGGPPDGPLLLLRDGELVAMGEREGARVKPRKVFLHG